MISSDDVIHKLALGVFSTAVVWTVGGYMKEKEKQTEPFKDRTTTSANNV